MARINLLPWRAERRVHCGSFQESMRGWSDWASPRAPRPRKSSCAPGSMPGEGFPVDQATCPSSRSHSTTCRDFTSMERLYRR